MCLKHFSRPCTLRQEFDPANKESFLQCLNACMDRIYRAGTSFLDDAVQFAVDDHSTESTAIVASFIKAMSNTQGGTMPTSHKDLFNLVLNLHLPYLTEHAVTQARVRIHMPHTGLLLAPRICSHSHTLPPVPMGRVM